MASLPPPGTANELKAAAIHAATELVTHAMTIRPTPDPLRHVLDLVTQFGPEKAIVAVAQSLVTEMRNYRW